ncbi:DUF2953 domain-containing protein [Bacillus dakarensis]|uniref:DUF2953 domain-containing protein n=1 Tax=Robertmurraya dakarensis TaxID=1926278 RepID=UPI000980CD1D|nr:DUF2953 domain-containing protein [Bacillus dakarensis]
MKWVLLVLLVLLFLLLLFLFTKLRVYIDYYHGQNNDHLEIKFKALLGLIQYKLNVPVMKMDDDSPSLVVKEKVEAGPNEKDKAQDTKKFTPEEMLDSFKDVNQLLKHVVGLYKIVRWFLSKTVVTKMEWNTVVGVGDAAYTGMICGAFWTVKGSLIGLVSTLMKVKTIPQIMVTPNFNATMGQTSFKCMIMFRIGHAMFAGIKLIKYWKGGKPRFRTKPLAHFSQNKTKSI